MDIQTGQRLLDRRAQAVEVALHRDVEAGELLTVRIEEVDAGLADRGPDDVGAARRADDRIGDFWIGHQHVLDVARQLDHHRLADPERNELGAGLAAHHLDHRRARVACRDGRFGGGCAPGCRKPEGSGQRNEQCGADQRRVPHSRSLCHHVYFVLVVVLMPKRTTLTPTRRRSVIVDLGPVLGAEIDKAPQCERERAELARDRERLGLARVELDRGGLADYRALAVLLLDRLVDCQHAHVDENDLADVNLHAGALFRRPIAAREDDVDVVVGQDESAGSGLGRNFERDREHARGQDGCHIAATRAFDQLGFADGLAGGKRRARDRARELLDGVRPLALANERRSGSGRRPHLPAQVLRAHRVAQADIGAGDQDVGRFDLRHRRRGRRIRSSGKQCGNAAGNDGDKEHNDTRGFHTLRSQTHAAAVQPQLPIDAPTDNVVAQT